MVMDMVMVDMATMDIMARGLLNLLLPLSPDMDMAMDMVMGIILGMVDMAIMDTMVRGLLRLSLDMGIMVMDMVMVMDMDMATDTMDTMARDLLRLSPDMDIMAMDMDTMDMVMVMDTMVKQEPECCFRVQSTNEVFPYKDLVIYHTLLKYNLKLEIVIEI